MNSWKSVLAGIVFAYLVIASAISLAVQYFAGVPQVPMNRQVSSYAEKIPVIAPWCFHENSRNFSGPDDNPSYVPMQSCDEYGS
jgi:hypothetical protein